MIQTTGCNIYSYRLQAGYTCTYIQISNAKYKRKSTNLYPGSPLKASTEPLDKMVSPDERSFARAHSAI